MFKIKFEGTGNLENICIEKFQEDKRQGYKLSGTEYKEVKEKGYNSLKEVLKELKKEGYTLDELNLMPMKVIESTNTTKVLEIELSNYISFNNVNVEGIWEENGYEKINYGGYAKILGAVEEKVIIEFNSLKNVTALNNKNLSDYVRKHNIIPKDVTGIVSKCSNKVNILFTLDMLVKNKNQEDYKFVNLLLEKSKKELYIVGSEVVISGDKLGYTILEAGKQKFVELFVKESNKKRYIELIESEKIKGKTYKYLRPMGTEGYLIG